MPTTTFTETVPVTPAAGAFPSAGETFTARYGAEDRGRDLRVQPLTDVYDVVLAVYSDMILGVKQMHLPVPSIAGYGM